MVSVAIVEDDKAALLLLADYLDKYGKEHQIEIKTYRFSDAVSFLEGYRPIYDIVFMDIRMPYINGMDAAIKMREIDGSVSLVFVTNMAQYAPQGYEVSAKGFLIKPVTYYSFYTLMDKIIRTTVRDKDSEMVVHIKEGLKVVPHSDIQYIEVIGHTLRIVTEKAVLETTGNLVNIEKLLPGDKFVRCNSGYLVHLKFVKGIKGNVVQVGNDFLTISRSRKKSFTYSLLSYFGDRI